MDSSQSAATPTSTAAQILEDVNKHTAAYQGGDLRAREAAVSSAFKLISELETPSETIVRMLWCWPTQLAVVRTAVELDVFQHLASGDGSPKTSMELAKATACDPIIMSRILRNLAAIEFVQETKADTFTSTKMSKALTEGIFQDGIKLMTDVVHPGSVKTAEFFRETKYQNVTDPLNTPMQYAYNCPGQHTFELFQKLGVYHYFDSLMKVWARGRSLWADEKAGFYPFSERLVSGARKGQDQAFLVDIGGSQGHDLLRLLALHPQETLPGKLVLQDLPQVVGTIKADVLPASIEVMAHDAFTPQPVKGARTYFMHSVIHDFPDQKAKEILKQVAAVMEKGYSKLILWDQVMPDKGTEPIFEVLDWLMMTFLAAQERSEARWRALLEDPEVGLKLTGVWYYSQYDQAVIEAELA